MAVVDAKCIAADWRFVDGALPEFTGADMSTNLKLLGCDVASLGVKQP